MINEIQPKRKIQNIVQCTFKQVYKYVDKMNMKAMMMRQQASIISGGVGIAHFNMARWGVAGGCDR